METSATAAAAAGVHAPASASYDRRSTSTGNIHGQSLDVHPLLIGDETNTVNDDDDDDPAGKKQRYTGGVTMMVRRMISDVSQTAVSASSSSTAVVVAAAASSGATADPSSSSSDNKEIVCRTMSTVGWVGFGVLGWYVPRYILDRKFDTILAKQPPYQMFDNGQDGDSGNNIIVLDFLLNNPLVHPPTVNGYWLKMTSIVLPLLIMIVYTVVFLGMNRHQGRQRRWFQRQSWIRLYATICTLISSFAMSIGISEGTTVMIKQWVQRRRPNFYALCGFSSTDLKCTAQPVDVVEAQLSFPSGHSSLVACGMTFMSLYLHYYYATVHATNSQSTRLTTTASTLQFFWKTLCPLWFALFVASSRVVDYWHHPSDIIAGLLLGSVAALLTFRFWYDHAPNPTRRTGSDSVQQQLSPPTEPSMNNNGVQVNKVGRNHEFV